MIKISHVGTQSHVYQYKQNQKYNRLCVWPIGEMIVLENVRNPRNGPKIQKNNN